MTVPIFSPEELESLRSQRTKYMHTLFTTFRSYSTGDLVEIYNKHKGIKEVVRDYVTTFADKSVFDRALAERQEESSLKELSQPLPDDYRPLPLAIGPGNFT